MHKSVEMNFDVDHFGVMAAAIEAGNIQKVKEVVKNNPSLLSEITPLGSWLYYAVGQNQLDIVNLLIQLGADLNLGSSVGDTPLSHAAVRAHKSVVSTLIEKGALIKTSTQDENPLFSAIGGSDPQIVQIFLDAGIDPTIRYVEDGGIDAMSHAIIQGRRVIGRQIANWIAKGDDDKSAVVYEEALDYVEKILGKPLEDRT